jgi:protein-disulfide isomerase
MRTTPLSNSRWLSWRHRQRYSAPVAGMKTVLTNSGVLYVTEDGKHIIQGPMYDVSGAQPVNVTNQLLMKNLNALEKEMIVYKAAQEKHVITVFTDITCGYCHKLHEEMKDYNALGITVRYLAFRARACRASRAGHEGYLVCERPQQSV